MCEGRNEIFVLEKNELGPILFAIFINSLLKDWQGRVKFVDDATLLEIVPRCSPGLLYSLLTKSLNLHLLANGT